MNAFTAVKIKLYIFTGILVVFLCVVSARYCSLIPVSLKFGSGNFDDHSHLGTAPLQVRAVGETPLDWTVVGPFPAPSGSNSFNVDFLSRVGVQEKAFESRFSSLVSTKYDLVYKNLKDRRVKASLSSTRLTMHPHGVSRVQPDSGAIDFQMLYYGPNQSANISDEGSVYLYRELISETERSVYLLLGSNDGVKVWLNSVELISVDSKRNIRAYDNILKLNLIRGRNRLLIKVWTAGGGWAFCSRLEAEKGGAIKAAITSGNLATGMILPGNFFKRSESMTFAPFGIPKGMQINASIVDEAGVVHFLSSVGCGDEVTPRGLSEGFYLAKVTEGGAEIGEWFYLGDIDQLAEKLASEVRTYTQGTPFRLDCEALLRRYEILSSAKNRPTKRSHSWERRALWALKNLDALLRKKTDGAPDAFQVDMRLHAFKSKIDDQLQHYRIALPSGSLDRKLPLVIMLPTATSANRPFIESVFMAGQLEAEEIASIANKNQVIVAWSGYRHAPVPSLSDLAHLDEVLNDISKRYKVDEGRVSLMGACSSGAMASMAISYWPARFCGVGLLNPMFSSSYEGIDFAAHRKLPGFSDWISRALPDRALAFTDSLPSILLVNDGADVGHGELSESENFIEFLNRHKEIGELRIVPQTKEHHLIAWENIIFWLADKYRETPSDEIAEGYMSSAIFPSVSAVFADRFTVVKGTSGNTEKSKAIDGLANAFLEYWRKAHYGPCRVCFDKDILPDDVRNSNLILIGDFASNSIWAEIDKNKRVDDYLRRSLGDDYMIGETSFQLVSMNPLSPRKIILYVGTNDLSELGFGGFNWTLHGWFKSAIWSRGKLIMATNLDYMGSP